MGQKANQTSVRLALKNTSWASEYIENVNSDATINVFQDLNIRKYLHRFFILHGLVLVNCFINKYKKNLDFFISYFITSNFLKLLKFRLKNNLRYSKKRLKKKRVLKILKKKKFFILEKIKRRKVCKNIKFISKLVSSLNLFFKKKYNIQIIFQVLNKSLSFRLKNKEAFHFRKIITKLRFYSRSNFFFESINILLIFIKKKSMVKLLSNFISAKLSLLKKHNFFLTFIKRSLILLLNSQYSLVKGLKIRINGRFNGAARSKTRVFQINKIPLQTLDANIQYYQSISYTLNGTFGVKLWVYTY